MLQACLNTTEDQCDCLAFNCPIVYSHSESEKEACYMEHCFISKRALDDVTLYKVTALYIFIFLVGVIGNTTTCLVMKKHPMMKTHASMYLMNLAVSDLVTLCVGLPFEVMMNWNQYPWPFPDYICNLKALIAETTSSVSILTILIFAIERYVAVCHPLFLMKVQPFKRNIGTIIGFTWIFSILCAMPFAIHHRADYIMKSWPGTDNRIPVKSSKMCMIAVMFEPKLASTFKILFHFSAIAFFALPLFTIVILYARIACKVSSNRTIQPGELDITEELQMRINAILCAIVSAFFICYLPFQLQRLLFFYFDNEVILTWVNQYMYFISGFLFYLATIINPIAYNLASSRFRRAFKDILIDYCWRGGSERYPRSSFSKYSLAHTPLRQAMSNRVPILDSKTNA
ncbi:G-protein coupled receptors family 1 profile domain-containing protein [Caenorhabditis elegans]|uniref:G-protein coupled receptors family 1 profile domain-containing protein n=1 Tax=Caenorhabditis elegans TaxID=6239 RepID=Q18701_CAEEL|nr:G-protein coupled receptors family 1 profile domain-containing protein [Caenorhabditis elegans]ADW41778.1 neuromedin U receptor [Caenorhabditis elegans]CCD83378.2 G-protein coupled receptors family 1 profile domain-containing protein [Caenorhabditis elegans]|eukprot:NP_509515.3 NMUR (NeuroMedin U Receptor) homolog [Caenorhabditis elegans]